MFYLEQQKFTTRRFTRQILVSISLSSNAVFHRVIARRLTWQLQSFRFFRSATHCSPPRVECEGEVVASPFTGPWDKQPAQKGKMADNGLQAIYSITTNPHIINLFVRAFHFALEKETPGIVFANSFLDPHGESRTSPNRLPSFRGVNPPSSEKFRVSPVYVLYSFTELF